MFKKFLVPLNGSDNAEKILGWMTGLARVEGADISLLTVVNPAEIELPRRGPGQDRPIPGKKPLDSPATAARYTGSIAVGGPAVIPDARAKPERAAGYGTQVIDRAVVNAKRFLDHEAAQLSMPGISMSTHVSVGSPVDEIVSRASDTGADLIVMATHRGSAIARGILGSVTDRVLHSSSVPVLTVHPGDVDVFVGNAGAPNVIIVPLDGSEISERAVGPAVEIAGISGARLLFIESISQLAGSGIDYYYIGDEQRQLSLEYLSGFVQHAKDEGLEARARVAIGPPAVRIIEEAHGVEGALIVMSTHGASGLKRWVVGSVTDKVIRSSNRPVLVIPPEAD